jgi:hypothetical protein
LSAKTFKDIFSDGNSKKGSLAIWITKKFVTGKHKFNLKFPFIIFSDLSRMCIGVCIVHVKVKATFRNTRIM